MPGSLPATSRADHKRLFVVTGSPRTSSGRWPWPTPSTSSIATGWTPCARARSTKGFTGTRAASGDDETMPVVEQRVSLITLGGRDLARARAFYESLGWQTGASPEDDVVFFQAPGMIVALWDRARLAEDSSVEDAPGWGGMTLAYNTRTPDEVDAVIEEARAAGAVIGREPSTTFWGG